MPPSRIFENVTILDAVLHGSREQFASRPVDFSGFRMDPDDFELKIHEISAFRPKCFLDVARSDPELKIHVFLQSVTLT